MILSFNFLEKWRSVENFNRIIILFLLASMALCPNLWLSERYFPTAPLFDFFHFNNAKFDLMLLYLFGLFAILSLIYAEKKVFIIGLIISSVILSILDINRLQPWFYQYILMLIFVTIEQKKFTSIKLIFQLLFLSIYFFSGLAKLNSSFFSKTIPFLLYNDQAAISGLYGLFKLILYCSPVIEMSIPFLLLTQKWRNWGLILIILSHLFILLLLSPFGINYNSVVWPWNVFMMIMSILLFYNENNQLLSIFKTQFQNWSLKISFIIFFILPLLGLFQFWPANFSFQLYSGKSKYAKVFLGEGIFDRIPQKIKNEYQKNNEERVINCSTWAYFEMNVLPFPSEMIAQSHINFFKKYSQENDDFFVCYYEPFIFENDYNIKIITK